MRAIVQRVSSASVTVNNNTVAKIGWGLAVLIGIQNSDSIKNAEYVFDKIVNMRIFEDENEKMNLSVKDINGNIIIVPNFTLYADAKASRRPSFSRAGGFEMSNNLFEEMKLLSQEKYAGLFQFGIFGADMKLSLLNDGPVTIILDTDI